MSHGARSCHQRLWLVNLKFLSPFRLAGDQGSVARQTGAARWLEATDRRHSKMDVGGAVFLNSRCGRRTDETDPTRYCDLGSGRICLSKKALLRSPQNAITAVHALRELQRILERTLLLAVRAGSDRLPAFLSTCDCRCS